MCDVSHGLERDICNSWMEIVKDLRSCLVIRMKWYMIEGKKGCVDNINKEIIHCFTDGLEVFPYENSH